MIKRSKALRRLLEDISELEAAASNLTVDDDDDDVGTTAANDLELRLSNKVDAAFDRCHHAIERSVATKVRALEDRIKLAEEFSQKLLGQLGALVRKIDDVVRKIDDVERKAVNK